MRLADRPRQSVIATPLPLIIDARVVEHHALRIRLSDTTGQVDGLDVVLTGREVAVGLLAEILVKLVLVGEEFRVKGPCSSSGNGASRPP